VRKTNKKSATSFNHFIFVCEEEEKKKTQKGEDRTSFGMAVVREKRNLSMKKKVLEDEKEE
jgi:hypothetical protein